MNTDKHSDNFETFPGVNKLIGSASVVSNTRDQSNETRAPLTCERCGNKTDAGAWLGFAYVGAECLTKADQEYIK